MARSPGIPGATALTLIVLDVRAHSSVIDGEDDAAHHAHQWAIQVRLSHGGQTRTWWQWIEARFEPTLAEAAAYAARGIVQRFHDTKIEWFDPTRAMRGVKRETPI